MKLMCNSNEWRYCQEERASIWMTKCLALEIMTNFLPARHTLNSTKTQTNIKRGVSSCGSRQSKCRSKEGESYKSNRFKA